LRSLTQPNLFVRWLLLSWVVTMSASPALAEAPSVVRLVGMGARRMKRTRTSDSVAGYMLQRRSGHHAMHKQGERGLVDNALYKVPVAMASRYGI
jgi:hypothetical protein